MRLHPERGGSHSVPGHYEKAWRHYGGWSEPWCCEARVDEDCEALGDLEQPHALQNPSFLSKYGLVVTMLATLLATCALASWWWLGVESSRESTKWTKFGEVPMTLRLSGVDCRRGDGNEDANGQYIYQGQTADGRPYYRHYDKGRDAWLYYDKECDGAKGGNNDSFVGNVHPHTVKTLNSRSFRSRWRQRLCRCRVHSLRNSRAP